MRHLRIVHPNIYETLKGRNIERKRKIRNVNSEIKIEMSIEKLYAALVELVSKNGRPFYIVSDSELRMIIDPIIDGIYKCAG